MMDWLTANASMVVLVLFMAIFLAFAFWAYRPANRAMLKEYGDIPLKESRDGQ